MVAVRKDWCRVRDFHPQPLRSKRSASGSWANAAKWRIRQDSHPQTLRSKRSMIVISLRMQNGASAGTCTLTAPLKRRILCCSSSRSDCDTKAELNRRGQACGILAGTGISRRENEVEMVGHEINRPLYPGLEGLSRRPPARIYQYLCPKIGITCWNRAHLLVAMR